MGEPRDELAELWRAAVQAGLASERETLLGGLSVELKARLPAARSPASQLLSDLCFLSEHEGLELWLRNAELLSGGQQAARVFSAARERVSAGDRLSRGLGPTPAYASPDQRAQGEELAALHRRWHTFTLAGASASAIEARIQELRGSGGWEPGRHVDHRYRLIDELGAGGFATVWRAWDLQEQEEVVLRQLHPALSGEAEPRRRFLAGARRMATLQSAHIARVHAVVEAEPPYVVMEHLAGGDLQRAVEAGRMGRAELPALLRELVAALDSAHQQGVIHRDLKPSNILLDRADRPVLTDFDLAREIEHSGDTATGTPLGSLLYAAPELLEDASTADARADQFGLAMVALFIAHGAELTMSLMDATRRNEFIDGLELSPALSSALRRALSRDPAARFPTIRDFGAAALRVEEGPAPRSEDTPRRGRWRPLAALPLLLLLPLLLWWARSAAPTISPTPTPIPTALPTPEVSADTRALVNRLWAQLPAQLSRPLNLRALALSAYEELQQDGQPGLRALEELAGAPVYLSGPHGDELALRDRHSFGHLNPAFIDWARVALTPGLSDAGASVPSPRTYQAWLKEPVRLFLTSWALMERRPHCVNREAEAWRAARSASAEGAEATEGSEHLVGYHRRWERWLEHQTCPGDSGSPEFHIPSAESASPPPFSVAAATAFWFRRREDGTAPLLVDWLEALVEVYDTGWSPLGDRVGFVLQGPATRRDARLQTSDSGAHMGVGWPGFDASWDQRDCQLASGPVPGERIQRVVRSHSFTIEPAPSLGAGRAIIYPEDDALSRTTFLRTDLHSWSPPEQRTTAELLLQTRTQDCIYRIDGQLVGAPCGSMGEERDLAEGSLVVEDWAHLLCADGQRRWVRIELGSRFHETFSGQ